MKHLLGSMLLLIINVVGHRESYHTDLITHTSIGECFFIALKWRQIVT